MREAYILGFRFWYLDAQGRRRHLLSRIGSVTDEGVMLEGKPILYEDIYRTALYRNMLIISMKPFATTSREICTYVVDRYNSVVLKVEKMMGESIKSAIDQRCTTMLAEGRWAGVPKEVRLREFKRVNCPRCSALHDLTGLVHTNLVYCKYCTAIFDHFGNTLPNSELYRACPTCGYYDRVRDYWEYDMYYVLNDRKFKRRRQHYCDTCVHRHFRESILKNLTFGIGAVVSLWEKWRSTRDRNPFYKELTEANYLAQTGNMLEADVLYSSIVFQNDGHPGLHMNYGLAHLQQGEEDRAAYEFKRALQSCGNYLPVLDILRRHVQLGEAEE